MLVKGALVKMRIRFSGFRFNFHFTLSQYLGVRVFYLKFIFAEPVGEREKGVTVTFVLTFLL